MSLKFSGSSEDLKQLLAELNRDGEWLDLNQNQIQFRHSTGAIINWYPSTGTINFQGKPDGVAILEPIVRACLKGDSKQSRKTKYEPAKFANFIKSAIKSTVGGRRKVVSEEGKPNTETTADSENQVHAFSNSEIVIGLVGAVGTDLGKVIKILSNKLKIFGYDVELVSISSDIIPKYSGNDATENPKEYERISSAMDAGNEARRKSDDNSILALGSAAWICSRRERDDKNNPKHARRKAYIIKSLKRPEEAERFRQIYPQGFYMIGVFSDKKTRSKYLIEEGMTSEEAQRLINRDQDEKLPNGQLVANTFHMSDVFVRMDVVEYQLKHSLWRFLEIIFGHPYRTPTFDEYSMYLAFAASLRSADLARQVGAVIAKDNEVLATGANDCPRYGGGLYWPEFDDTEKKIIDQKDGRDYMRDCDANVIEQKKIIDDIVEKAVGKGLDEQALREVLDGSQIRDLTEYGRVVHAEMEALLCCGRNHISTRKASLYCTTFPCHNCAKHIIAAGIERVIYIEPYAKSKAAELHSDAITLGFSEKQDKKENQVEQEYVHFEPFVGIGPRRFFDLFSMRLGSGSSMKRKDDEGQTLDWKENNAQLRLQMLPHSYLQLEQKASARFDELVREGES